MQAYSWSAGYGLFVLTCAATSWQAQRALAARAGEPAAQGAAITALPLEEAVPGIGDYVLWLALSALGSVLLLASTSHITQNIASVPFLWVLPLTLYLLTFVLAFEGRGGRGWFWWWR
jgi:hypothetical protein